MYSCSAIAWMLGLISTSTFKLTNYEALVFVLILEGLEAVPALLDTRIHYCFKMLPRLTPSGKGNPRFHILKWEKDGIVFKFDISRRLIFCSLQPQLGFVTVCLFDIAPIEVRKKGH